MKFMKIGTRPDTFYTEEAVRTLISDVPSDLSIHINNISYLLHKFALVARCGLLQRLCSESSESESSSSGIELHDIPGGEEAFEVCAKFCYGITVDLGAHNVVAALCAAKFLRMTEAVEKGNLVVKLEAFFNSCVLDGWKDSILALQTTLRLPDWSHNLGIVRKCIDSIVEKILTHPHKVNWSFTYTRPGYNKKTHPVPKDWWTEDVSDLDVDLFRCVITALRAVNVLPPQLIGEALHVYASRWLPNPRSSTTTTTSSTSSSSTTTTNPDAGRRTLEAVVGMIPPDRGSVSAGFLLRLLSSAAGSGASHATRAELLRKCATQLEDAAVEELVFPAGGGSSYDVDLVMAVVESFMTTCRRQAAAPEGGRLLAALRKVGRLVDRYLQVVARDVNMPVSKFVTLAESVVPDLGRETHDDLYKAINIFLKSHPELNKAEKKRLCRILDCQKLSPEVRAHAVKNERLPLRTVVQLLFFEQERGNANATAANAMMARLSLHPATKPAAAVPDDKCSTTGGDRPNAAAATAGSETGESLPPSRRAPARRTDRSGEIEGMGEGMTAASKLDVRMMSRKGSRGRDR